MEDKTHIEWDNSAEWYDQNMGDSGDLLNNKIIKPKLLEMIGSLNNKVVLDAGCGSGYVSAELSQTAKKVIGTDFSEKFIQLCTTKYSSIKNLSFLIADVTTKLPFSALSFDSIISKMVLQYVPQINVFSEESYRITKHNGSLVVIIDHPFHTQYFYAQQIAGKPSSKYPNLNNYYSNLKQTKLSLWGKVELTWYPKTVSQYVLPFIQAGWSLKDMVELPETKDGITLPRILMLKFSKI